MYCEVDGTLLTSARTVYSHNKLHLNDEYHCNRCEKNFITKEYLIQHQKKVHTDAQFQCNECDMKFKTKDQLKKHVLSIHLKIDYNCDSCSQTFTRPDSLKRHKAICKKGDDQNYEREMMDFFENNTGTGYQKKFEEFTSKETCKDCSKQFSSKSSLKTHVLNVHLSNKKKTCKFCKHIFSSKTNFIKHMRTQHKSVRKTEAKGFFMSSETTTMKCTRTEPSLRRKIMSGDDYNLIYIIKMCLAYSI